MRSCGRGLASSVPSEQQKTSEARSRTMRAVRSQNTGLEMRVRRLMHSMGYRYRLYVKELPGKPDLVFRSRKRAIFVHGCFWHGHDCSRGARLPRDNAEYWRQKITKNRLRDVNNQALLASEGWKVLVVWECQTKDLNDLAAMLTDFME